MRRCLPEDLPASSQATDSTRRGLGRRRRDNTPSSKEVLVGTGRGAGGASELTCLCLFHCLCTIAPARAPLPGVIDCTARWYRKRLFRAASGHRWPHTWRRSQAPVWRRRAQVTPNMRQHQHEGVACVCQWGCNAAKRGQVGPPETWVESNMWGWMRSTLRKRSKRSGKVGRGVAGELPEVRREGRAQHSVPKMAHKARSMAKFKCHGSVGS